MSELPRFAEEWDELHAASRAVPVLGTTLIGTALDAFRTGREVLAVYARDREAIAMGIFIRGRFGAWRTFQPSQLPLGAFVARPDLDVDAALGALVASLPGIASAVSLTQQDPALLAKPAASPTLVTLPYIETAWVDVAASFDDYWAARGKNLRTNVRRQLARLDAEGSTHRLETVANVEDVGAAIDEYGALETAGWKAQGGTAVHADNVQGRFYRDLFERFCGAGRGRIYRYRIGERIAAMDLCIEDAGTLVILKTAYDEAFKAVSPASLMRYEYFRPLFDGHQIRRIEFYGRLMDWHTRWTGEKRTLYHVNRYRSALVGRVRALMAPATGS